MHLQVLQAGIGLHYGDAFPTPTACSSQYHAAGVFAM
jgi:hypothetical protein